MMSDEIGAVSEVSRLALASSRAADRGVWRGLFILDARLATIVSHAREPLLVQMRFAWWREELAKPAQARASGDPALAALVPAWSGSESALIDLVDGWESLLGDEPRGADALRTFVQGRGAACAAAARLIGCEAAAEGAQRAGEIWALAELAARAPNEEERGIALELARALPPPPSLPPALRPLAVIAGLSRRAVAREGAPLLGDRLSPLVAFRLGILGR